MAKKTASGGAHQFGGSWTDQKLEILRKYLVAYATALSKTSFKTAYIDAFAGTGSRLPTGDRCRDPSSQQTLFELEDPVPPELLDGSARVALKSEPPFDRYLFVDRDKEHCDQLRSLGAEFPERKGQISVHEQEANEFVQDLCRKNWKQSRAVLFLDPYGMNVDWATIEAVASTRAIDLWLLFPLGIGVNRLLSRSGARMPEGWKNRLNLLLGTEDWFSEFYKVERQATFFGDEDDISYVKTATLGVIGKYFLDRLRSVFAGVADNPAFLRNSVGNPLYLLCFAAGNEKGAPIAKKIAQHILKKIDRTD